MKFRDVVFNFCQICEIIVLICAILVLAPIACVTVIFMSPVMLYDWYERERRSRKYEARCKEVFGDRITPIRRVNSARLNGDEPSYMP